MIYHVVYLSFSYIYWSDWGDKPKIERANLSGKDRITIVDHHYVKWVSSIAVDPTLERIYWIDMNKRHIYSSDVNGKQKMLTVSGLTNPYGVAVFEDYVYWTDLRLKKLYKTNRFKPTEKIKLGSNLSQPMDIKVYHPLIQTEGMYALKFVLTLCSIKKEFEEFVNLCQSTSLQDNYM